MSMSLFPWISLLCGVGCFYMSKDTSKVQKESYHYPTADGMVIKILEAVDTAPGQYDLELSYLFWIDGKEHQGNKFNFSSGITSKEEFYALKKKYHVGQKLKVYHHSTKHYINALSPGPINNDAAWEFFAGIFLVLLAIWSGIFEFMYEESFFEWIKSWGK